MVDITDIAVEKAKEVLEAEGKAAWGLKIFSQGSGCCGPQFGMDIIEAAAEGDNTVEKNGLKVFADDSTVESLRGMTIDYVEQDGQAGFVVRSTEPPACSCSGGTC